MSFTLSHIFEGNLEELQISPKQLEGKIKWYLQSRLKDGNIKVTLYGVPLEGFVRRGVYWKILADVDGTIGTTEIKLEKCNFHYDKKFSYYGRIIFQQEKKLFLENEKIVEDGKISVNLKIEKITTEGIRDFELLDFSRSNLLKSDLALSIGKQKLFCHSLILSLGSPVFADLLTKKKYSKFNLIKDIITFISRREPLQIELDSEMSVEDFKEFLHQLYFAAEPIREDNWEILLHFAGKYEAAQILLCCEKFLLAKLVEVQPKVEKTKAIEMLPLSCRYGMEILKSKCFDNLGQCRDRNEISKIFTNKHYLAIDEDKKLEMLQSLILKML